MRRLQSLRAILLRPVLLSLAAIWLLGTAISLAVAYFFAQRAFDRSILDDAYLVGSAVQVREGRPHLALTPDQVKDVVTRSADDLRFTSPVAQGSGRLDLLGASLTAPGWFVRQYVASVDYWLAARVYQYASDNSAQAETGTGTGWNGSRWSGSRWSGSRWSGSRWSGSRWSGSRWSGDADDTQGDQSQG